MLCRIDRSTVASELGIWHSGQWGWPGCSQPWAALPEMMLLISTGFACWKSISAVEVPQCSFVSNKSYLMFYETVVNLSSQLCWKEYWAGNDKARGTTSSNSATQSAQHNFNCNWWFWGWFFLLTVSPAVTFLCQAINPWWFRWLAAALGSDVLCFQAGFPGSWTSINSRWMAFLDIWWSAASLTLESNCASVGIVNGLRGDPGRLVWYGFE